MSGTDKSKKKEKSFNNFSNLVDTSSDFLKTIYPYAYNLVSAVFRFRKKRNKKKPMSK